MDSRVVLSVGIDVGTTTTQVVASRLTIRNTHRFGLMPRLDIDATDILFVSDPEETPLTAPDEIDVEALHALIRRQYGLAGVAASEVETGAVIITGETARTRNAAVILDGLAGLAGDFVVTVAGPNVESLVAGRGCGAAAWSAQRYTCVVTVDIGGGSANAALFRAGQHVASAAAMVGGRQARLDPTSGTLTHLAPSGRIIADHLGLDLIPGQRPTVDALRALTDAMADVVVELCLGERSALGARVGLTDPLPVRDPVTAHFVSGGVGLLYYDDAPAETLEQIAAYGDVGPLLARSLREHPRWRALRVERPEHTLRATVLGAASRQVTLSGSTIWADDDVLPLRNLPVIAPALDHELTDPDAVGAALREAHDRWHQGDEPTGVAIALDLPARLGYRQLRTLAAGISDFAAGASDFAAGASDFAAGASDGAAGLTPGTPLVLVTERDVAKAIGQSVKALACGVPLVVVDQIDLGEGDVIDIGEPMFDGRVVPVSVKTLVFYEQPRADGSQVGGARVVEQPGAERPTTDRPRADEQRHADGPATGTASTGVTSPSERPGVR